MTKRLKREKSFTLIELLVVIAIIGLLVSIVLVSFGPTREKARDAQRQSDVKQVNLAMELCYSDENCGEGKDKYISTTNGVSNAKGTVISTYLTVPTDPKDDEVNSYFYRWTTNSGDPAYQYYCFYAKMEAEDNTWFCASNKGVNEKTQVGYTPSNDDCCGVDIN